VPCRLDHNAYSDNARPGVLTTFVHCTLPFPLTGPRFCLGSVASVGKPERYGKTNAAATTATRLPLPDATAICLTPQRTAHAPQVKSQPTATYHATGSSPRTAARHYWTTAGPIPPDFGSHRVSPPVSLPSAGHALRDILPLPRSRLFSWVRFEFHNNICPILHTRHGSSSAGISRAFLSILLLIIISSLLRL